MSRSHSDSQSNITSGGVRQEQNQRNIQAPRPPHSALQLIPFTGFDKFHHFSDTHILNSEAVDGATFAAVICAMNKISQVDNALYSIH